MNSILAILKEGRERERGRGGEGERGGDREEPAALWALSSLLAREEER